MYIYVYRLEYLKDYSYDYLIILIKFPFIYNRDN